VHSLDKCCFLCSNQCTH